MKIDTTAKLIGVEGDQEEFADLIGETGRLFLSPGNNWFSPKGSGESLTMTRKRAAEKDGKIRVSTKLGNVFIFRKVETEQKVGWASESEMLDGM